MTNLAAKALVATAIVGGSLFATNGAAFAAGDKPSGTVVLGTGEDRDSSDTALGNAFRDAASQCQSGFTQGHADTNVYKIAGGTLWAAWVRIPCL
ncbi:hypothetical protein ABZZ74_53345 [Streptomyces sp. NPDC006476]|uniref:hypothetical protein n=1 Tax=Streptomyces sp. NPDC006476 TaxID=3157175 RepID=UPI0033A056BB